MNNSGLISQHTSDYSIDSLEQEKKLLKSQERYVEANEISQKIQQLKLKQHQEKLQYLKSTYNNEKELIERSFLEEISALEQSWGDSISSYIQKCDKEINSSVTKHNKKLKRLKDKLENEIMNSFKPSPGLLNMIKCKEQAVKQEKYIEAQALLIQIEQMKGDEELRHLDSRRVAIEHSACNFNANFDKKMQAMKKRQNRVLDEMNLGKNEEFGRVVKKFENLRRELENSQNIKINICEGRHTTSAGRHSRSPEKSNGSTLSPNRQRSMASKSDY